MSNAILDIKKMKDPVVERMKREMIWEMFKEMIHDGFVVYERKNNPDRCSIDLKMKIISIKL